MHVGYSHFSLIFSILPHANVCGTNSVCEMAHLCDQPIIVSEMSSSSIRFAAKCLTRVALSLPLLATTRYIRIIHLSSPCYIMRAADTHDLICDLMRAKFVTSLIVLHGYCVHNIHIRWILLPMSIGYETMNINRSYIAAFCSNLQNERLIFSREAQWGMSHITSTLYVYSQIFVIKHDDKVAKPLLIILFQRF